MEIVITHCERTVEPKSRQLVAASFTLHYYENEGEAGGDYTHSYSLTAEEAAAGDLDAVIKREAAVGQTAFELILTPLVTEHVDELIGASVIVDNATTTISAKHAAP